MANNPLPHLHETWESKDQSLQTTGLRVVHLPHCHVPLWWMCKCNLTNITYKHLATMLAEKWEQPYCGTLAWMRCKLSFALLRSSIQCIHGARSAGGHALKQSHLPADLVVVESNISLWTLLSILLKPFLQCIHFLAFYITRCCTLKKKDWVRIVCNAHARVMTLITVTILLHNYYIPV